MQRLFHRQRFQKWFAVGALLLFIPGFSTIVIAEVFANEKPEVVDHCLVPFEPIEVDIQPFPNLKRVF
jgi:hypothetical protein